MKRWLHAASAASLVFFCSAAGADEGMWPFHGFPFDKVNTALKTHLDQAWLDRARLATVRLANCTGSFVSGQGLILTNHHCVEGCLAELSSKDKSYNDDGYLARSGAEEKRCQTQVADVLTQMEDITAKVNAATAGKADAAVANDARKAALTQLEQACESSSQLKCQSVTLYEGGQYWLYKYKRYTDLRLVFAPEIAIGSFGGDPDNFQFPRWNLDMGVLRAYENGAPAKTPDYLKFNFAGPSVGDPVSGSERASRRRARWDVVRVRGACRLEAGCQWVTRAASPRRRSSEARVPGTSRGGDRTRTASRSRQP